MGHLAEHATLAEYICLTEAREVVTDEMEGKEAGAWVQEKQPDLGLETLGPSR